MSPPAEAPDALVNAIMAEVLDSFEKLEVLVALAPPAPPTTAAQLQSSLDFPDNAVADAVGELIEGGLIEQREHGLAIAEHGAWSPHCRALIAQYRADRMKVVTLMATAALTRLRSRTARAFSDAFILRSRDRHRRAGRG